MVLVSDKHQEAKTMNRKYNIFDRSEDFENHWNERCEEIKSTEMSLNDAKYCRLTFYDRREKFRASVLLEISSTSYSLKNEIDSRLDKVEDKVEGAILKARANFREKEKIRLKDAYGFLGALIYFILKITGRI